MHVKPSETLLSVTLTRVVGPPSAPAPEPSGSACRYWNGYGSSATTRLKDSPMSVKAQVLSIEAVAM